ncbi:MAG: hypothetical protein IKL48_03105 [Elusimicrobiaceae bacterium]|nr:hypothetical protein [Elusimicrobiaceae bacterium]
MKIFLLLLFLCFSLFAQAEELTVGQVSVQTTRMNPHVVKNKFPLKSGDVFSPLSYEYAQNKLHDMRLFKKLDFSTRQNKKEIDIHIQAEDGYYFFPLGFFSSGDKNVLFLSLFEGNFFKQGETAFASAGFSDDGYTLSGGLALSDHFFNLSFTKLDTELRFYPHHWSSTYGVMNVSDDEGEFGSPIGQLNMRDYSLRLLYARQIENWSIFIAPELRHTSYSQPLDAGNHNQITAGLAYRHHVRTSSGMGALFGFGLSDKQKMLKDLPYPRYAYAADVSFAKGGRWSGADEDISQVSANFLWQAEFKSRHIFSIQVKGKNAYDSSFSDQILSTDLLGKQGKYRRLIRGSRGAGLTAAFMYYLLRNQTGLLAFTPFYELAYIHTAHAYQNHSGTGATLSYKFWRFPFPLGLNYTHNLSDHSNVLSFVLGGQF